MPLVVDAHKIATKLHRLEIRVDGKFIGEYERAQAGDIDRKRAEVRCALEFLLSLYRKHGELKVRWNGARGEKIIYASGIEVGTVPRACWQRPSWVQ